MRNVSRTRAEAETDLVNQRDGWAHQEDWPRWGEAVAGLLQLDAGVTTVVAGHTTYRIQEAQAS